MKHEPRTTVLMLGPELSAVSGVATHVNLLLKSDLATIFKLHHIPVGSEGRNNSELFGHFRTVISPLTLGWKIIKTQAHVVHINTSLVPKAFWRDLVYLLVAKFLRSRVVYQVHGGSFERFAVGNRIFRRLVKWMLKIPDAIVVMSQKELKSCTLAGMPKRIFVAPNAVDLDGFRQCRNKDFESRILRVLYLGRLHRDKGVFDLVDAASLLHNNSRCCDFEFILAGNGPAEIDLRKKISLLELNETIKLVGTVTGKEKIAILRLSHVFLLPSYHEALPYAVLESVASGIPLVITPVGAIPEVIDNGVHAVFVRVSDPQEIASALCALATDRRILERMSIDCARHADENFGIDRLTTQLSHIYNQVTM